VKFFKDHADTYCKKLCGSNGRLSDECKSIGTHCIAYQIHENVNAHLTAKGAAFLLQSFLTWDWKYMYMFPGALWNTVIGGVGCSFKKPLTDYEFQCMRILVRDILSPYTLVEKEMVELSDVERKNINEAMYAASKLEVSISNFIKETTSTLHSLRVSTGISYCYELRKLFKSNEAMIYFLCHRESILDVNSMKVLDMFENASKKVDEFKLPVNFKDEIKNWLTKMANNITNAETTYNNLEDKIIDEIDTDRNNTFKITPENICFKYASGALDHFFVCEKPEFLNRMSIFKKKENKNKWYSLTNDPEYNGYIFLLSYETPCPINVNMDDLTGGFGGGNAHRTFEFLKTYATYIILAAKKDDSLSSKELFKGKEIEIDNLIPSDFTLPDSYLC